MKISKTIAVAASSVGVLLIGGGIAAAAALSAGGSGSAGQAPAGDQVTPLRSAVVVAATPTSSTVVAPSPTATATVRPSTVKRTAQRQEVTVSEPSTSTAAPQDDPAPTNSVASDSAGPRHHGPTYTGPVVNEPYGSMTDSPSASPQK